MLSHVRLSKIVVMMIITAAFSSTFLLAGENDSRPLLSLGLFASNYDPGWIVKMDAAGGYRFGRHFEFTAGVPVYFVRFPEGELEDTSGSKTGIGNVYMNLRAMAEVSGFYFSSSVRAAAPTGDEEEGFSTGRMTVDWNNYFEYDAGFLAPFASVGLANSVSDTHFFAQPYSSLGIVGQLEGGLLLNPAWWIGFGGSGYAVVPSGEQKIYSRVYRSAMMDSGTGAADAQRRRRGMLEESFYTVGDADLVRDRGFSAWLDIYAIRDLNLEAGYSRSVTYAWNTIFFSARYDLTGLFGTDRD
jgi:hypothetical protein